MKRFFEYDEDTGHATCELHDNDYFAYGFAQCHAQDEPYKSELTGCCIAEARALIDLKRMKRDDIKQQLKALNHLQNTFSTSKKYNPRSYEARMLKRQINHKKALLVRINSEINEEIQSLRVYMKNKDEIHTRMSDKANID